MDEIELISNLTDWYEAATIHFAAMTTFVVLYIAGLYVFLRRAPFPVRLLAYVFFVGTFLVYARMGIGFLANAYATADVLIEQMAAHSTSEAFDAWAAPKWYDAFPIAGLWYALVFMTVFALGWLTFFYRWNQAGEK